jgi:hypothetical protein
VKATTITVAIGCALTTLSLPSHGDEDALRIAATGAFDEFDSAVTLPPDAEGVERFALGDIHGFVHIFERRDSGFDEVWVSDFYESGIAGLIVADINLDDLLEIVVYTEGGRFHFLDLGDYHSIWSNPPTDYEHISVMGLHNVDDDDQVELLFVADGRLVVYDGRDRFEEWRSDQDNLTSTDLLVGDVDGDGAEEIVLNDGFVFDALYRDLEWQSPEGFGERIGLLDVDDDAIPEVVGEFKGRFLRIFDIDLRRMKSARR